MSVWKPNTSRIDNRTVNLANCRESCWTRESWNHTYQCTRKAIVFRCVDGYEGELGFCRQHDPVAVAAKNKARNDAWHAKWAAADAAHERDKQIKVAAEAARVALERIAAGHNDPRSLAAEVLALYPPGSEIHAPTVRQDAPAE